MPGRFIFWLDLSGRGRLSHHLPPFTECSASQSCNSRTGYRTAFPSRKWGMLLVRSAVSSQSFRVPMPRALAACFGLRASEGCSAGVSPQLVAARSSVGFFIPLRSLVSDGAVTAGRWKGNQCALPRKAIHFLARILLVVTDGAAPQSSGSTGFSGTTDPSGPILLPRLLSLHSVPFPCMRS